MAISKLLRLKESRSSNPSQHLKNLISYIFNPEKTMDNFWIGGNTGFTEKMCYENMVEIKELYGKRANAKHNCTQGYHYVLSFPPGETDEKTVFEITEQFCKEFLGDEYQYCFALHNDQPHLHTHIVFNSVAFDGHMYHSPKNDWQNRIQPLLNKYCKEYHLSYINTELEKGEEKKVKYGARYEKWNQQNKTLSSIDILRMDLDKAIMEANTIEEFQDILKNNGYEVRVGYNRKEESRYFTFSNWNLVKDGKPYRRRSNHRMLIDNYSYDRIIYRIQHKEEDTKISEVMEAAKNLEVWKEPLKKIYAMTELSVRKTYAQRIFFARVSGNKSFYAFPDAHKYQKDVVELNKITEEYYYIHDNEIQNIDDINSRLAEVKQQIKFAKNQKDRGSIYLKDLYRERRLLQRIKKNVEEFHAGDSEKYLERKENKRDIQKDVPVKLK